MYHLVPKWKWPIWDVEKTYQLVPKWDWTNREIAETYQLAPKWDWLIWDVKRTCQMMPKKDWPIWEVSKTYHRDLGFMKLKPLLAWTIYVHINRLLFFNRILFSGATLHNWRPHFASMIFPNTYTWRWKPSKTYTWRWSTYILFHSNVKHSSQNTVYRGPCWDANMTLQLIREWYGPICDVFATSHW